MRTVTVIPIVLVLMGALAACSNPHKDAARAQKKSHEAQEKVAEERLALVEEYKKCVRKAGSDEEKVEACDSYLKAAESLK